jgi:hypothetical protein
MNNPAVAAIEFALEDDSPMEFLRCWFYGDFDAIRREWPDAPEEVFIGADPLHPGTMSSLDEEAAFNEWFHGEQGVPYDGMWSFARAAWMARADRGD